MPKKSMDKLVARLRELMPQVTFAMVAYRDYSDGNDVLTVCKPSADPSVLAAFMGGVRCYGGGDEPEAVEASLEHVLGMSPDLAILVGDAPPHGVIDQVMRRKDYRVYAKHLGQKIFLSILSPLTVAAVWSHLLRKLPD